MQFILINLLRLLSAVAKSEQTVNKLFTRYSTKEFTYGTEINIWIFYNRNFLKLCIK